MVSVVRVVGSVLLVVGSVVELLVDELVGGTVVLVEVVAVVVVRLAGETLVGGSVRRWWSPLRAQHRRAAAGW